MAAKGEKITLELFLKFLIFRLKSTVNQRLSALNGKAFANLHQLETISLITNFCIWKDFSSHVIESWKSAGEVITKNCGFDEFEYVEVACEKFTSFFELEACWMKKKTSINATNFVVSDMRDEEVGHISFDDNKKIEYLPYKIFMQFPNLFSYFAESCSVKQITKENFEKLNRLKEIWLSHNKIQKIFANTFEGLESLQTVLIGKILILGAHFENN